MRKVKKTIIILILGVFFTPSISFCQIPDTLKEKMNRVSIQTGLFHYFFDKAPILNINYREGPAGPREGLFNQLFINSFGLQYFRKINTKNAVSIEANLFNTFYHKHVDIFPDDYQFDPPEALVLRRDFFSINVNYIRIEKVKPKVKFNFGGGVNYRHGSESILVNKGWFDLLTQGTNKRDFGLNAFAGIDFNPTPWLTLYSKIDFLGLVYLYDKENIEKLRNYPNMPDHYPSRFDLSLRFGIGVNF